MQLGCAARLCSEELGNAALPLASLAQISLHIDAAGVCRVSGALPHFERALRMCWHQCCLSNQVQPNQRGLGEPQRGQGRVLAVAPSSLPPGESAPPAPDLAQLLISVCHGGVKVTLLAD